MRKFGRLTNVQLQIRSIKLNHDNLKQPKSNHKLHAENQTDGGATKRTSGGGDLHCETRSDNSLHGHTMGRHDHSDRGNKDERFL